MCQINTLSIVRALACLVCARFGRKKSPRFGGSLEHTLRFGGTPISLPALLRQVCINPVPQLRNFFFSSAAL